MNHEPAQYNCVINFNFQQLMEVKKAITDRIVRLSIRSDYDYKEQDLDSLISISKVLDKHIDVAVNAWEDKLAKSESESLNDEQKLKDFLSDD